MSLRKDDGEDALVRAVEKVLKAAPSFHSSDAFTHVSDNSVCSRYERDVMTQLFGLCSVRPWLMLFLLKFYGRVLKYFDTFLANKKRRSSISLADLEHQACLQFASQFARLANAKGRLWCIEVIAMHGISGADATFLVWSKVIHLKTRTIHFNFLNQLTGLIMMGPGVILVSAGLLMLNISSPSPVYKLFVSIAYIATGAYFLLFYKSQIFDTFRIGARYFKSGDNPQIA